jgi:hypothetical protein
MAHNTAVIIVPSDLRELSRDEIMSEDRISRRRRWSIQ